MIRLPPDPCIAGADVALLSPCQGFFTGPSSEPTGRTNSESEPVVEFGTAKALERSRPFCSSEEVGSCAPESPGRNQDAVASPVALGLLSIAIGSRGGECYLHGPVFSDVRRVVRRVGVGAGFSGRKNSSGRPLRRVPPCLVVGGLAPIPG